MRFNDILRARRGRDPQRHAAEMADVNLSTYVRAEKGEVVDGLSLLRLFAWLGMDANMLKEQFLEDHEDDREAEDKDAPALDVRPEAPSDEGGE